ncbi:unnamed protein product [Phytomonas sp. EM1]|nr:unnamed protein product [Phytomonas sp. EM1]|eukprot:CCW65407.1 unnamed protein product [Phytomonas sp. isolate EM1]
MSNYRCQSALKLVELDHKFKIFCRNGCRTVVDLAAAPGGFSQVALEGMNKYRDRHHHRNLDHLSPLKPLVLAVDLRPIEPIADEVRILRCNVLHHRELIRQLRPFLNHSNANPYAATEDIERARSVTQAPTPRAVDVVLHDGVSVVAGQHAFSVTYAQNQMVLSALLFACKVFSFSPFAPSARETAEGDRPRFRPLSGGVFVSKLMHSTHLPKVLTATRRFFRRVHLHKPSACRAESLETYLIAEDFLRPRWETYLRGFTSFRGGRSANPFSLAPDVGDIAKGMAIVWVCLGCGQTRTSCAPCPTCMGMR